MLEGDDAPTMPTPSTSDDIEHLGECGAGESRRIGESVSGNHSEEKMPDLIIRPITREDIPKVKELHKKLLPVSYGDKFYKWLTMDEVIALKAEETTSSDAEADAGDTIGGEGENSIVGVSTVRFLPVLAPLREGSVGGWSPKGGKKSAIKDKGKNSEGLQEPANKVDEGSVDSDATQNPSRSSDQDRSVDDKKNSEGVTEGSVVTLSDVGYLMTFGVLPQYRKKGVGRMLLQTTLSHVVSRGGKSLTLHVKTDNDVALRFYERNGFTIIDHVKDYYTIDGRNENAYYLEWKPGVEESGSMEGVFNAVGLFFGSIFDAAKVVARSIYTFGKSFGWQRSGRLHPTSVITNTEEAENGSRHPQQSP